MKAVGVLLLLAGCVWLVSATGGRSLMQEDQTMPHRRRRLAQDGVTVRHTEIIDR